MREQTFEKEVLGSSVPVLVHFGAPWCGPCRMVEPILARFQAEWQQPIKLVKVNADDNLKLTNHYRIQTLPTILIFESGQLLHRLDGMYQRDTLWNELGRLTPKVLESLPT